RPGFVRDVPSGRRAARAGDLVRGLRDRTVRFLPGVLPGNAGLQPARGQLSANSRSSMKPLLSIDEATGRIVDRDGAIVFDPEVGPRFALRPKSSERLFEQETEDGVVVSVSFVEVNGGYLAFSAVHPRFGSSWHDWSEARDRAQMSWLVEFLR